MLEFGYSEKNVAMPVAYASFDAMHTSFEMLAVSVERAAAEQMANEIYAVVMELDCRLNRFVEGSEVGRLNNRSHSMLLDVQMFEILEMCQFLYASTKWNFDIAVNSKEMLPYGASRYLLNGQSRKIAFADDRVQLDFGGFAKGYALDRVKGILERGGVENALANFGNSSVVALGRHPIGGYWPVGVEDTFRRGQNARLFELKDSAMSLSGHTPRHRQHIRSPKTGEYVEQQAMVGVVGRSAMIAEALSTALFTAPQQERAEILALFPGYVAEQIECRPGGEAVVTRI